MERNGWGLAAMGATAMGRNGWGLAAMGTTAKGALVLMGVTAMRPMRLKRPSPAGKADEAEEAVTGVTIE